ncbi:MAG TPA: Ig-like domain-containing protein, partial [Opitutaceae bacterium]|nr:Ig-like domain-containing protein [Opitutaceae bacterium]
MTIFVSDGQLTSSARFDLSVVAVDLPPSISDLPNLSIAKGRTSGPISVGISDQDTEVSRLVLTAQSSNPTLLPLSGISLTGTDRIRTAVFTPTPSQVGTTTITLTVTDGVSSASTSFVLTVSSSNTPPTISDVANRSLVAGAGLEPIVFSVGDAETSPSALTVSATSSNPSLVDNSSLLVVGSGTSRTLAFTPIAGQVGSTTLTLTVNDGAMTASTSFVVTVTASSSAPSISSLQNRTIPMNGTTGAIAFSVSDTGVPGGSLTVTANSSNPLLVPDQNLVLDGSGLNRSITVTPASNQSGSAIIRVSVSNGHATTSTTFVLTVTQPNTPPSITSVASQILEADTVSLPIEFIVSDAQTPASGLSLTATSSNASVLTNGGISLGGGGGIRFLTLTPVAGKVGLTTVTLTVSDGSLTKSTSFDVTVQPKNTAPTISAIENRSTTRNAQTAAIDFTIADATHPVAGLTLSATSSNPALASTANISFGGSGANRWLRISPVSDQTGTATITVTVSDGQLTASSSFVLTVIPPNTAPTISALADRSTVVNRNSGEIEFTVNDAETAVGSLTVTGTSSNESILPWKNIVFGGQGGTRTVTLTPAQNQMGTATVTLTVSDGTLTSSASFKLTVTAASTAPKISDIPNRSIVKNGTAGVSFTVSDAETAASSLVVTAVSVNNILVPQENIIISGTGGNRSALITPAMDRTGNGVITFRVSDGTYTATASFTLTVTEPGTTPTMSRIFNRSINANSSTGAIAFAVEDSDTPLNSLVFSATSSNTTLVPNSNIVFGGSGGGRTLMITPVENRAGNTMITISVSDGRSSSSQSFFLTVHPVNVAPTLGTIANRALKPDSGSEQVGITIADVDTPVSSLTLTASSSNQALIPSSSITFSGAGSSRIMTLAPMAGQSGVATITVTVSDGNLSTSGSFVVTVGDMGTNPNDPSVPPDPAQNTITINRQPQNVTVALGASATVSIDVAQASLYSYQWFAGERGNTNSPIVGANKSTLTLPAVTATGSYWVCVSSSTTSVTSLAAVVTVSANERYFFGTVSLIGVSTGASGTQASGGGFGFMIRSDNTGLFLADGASLAQGIAVVSFNVSPQGTFSFDAPGVGRVSGTVVGSQVSGTIGASLAFAGTQEPAQGTAVPYAGSYRGALVNSSNSEIYALTGASGRAFVALSEGGVIHGKSANVSADGVIAVTLNDGRSIGLDTEGGRLYGSVVVAGAAMDVSGGREGTVVATRVYNMSVRAAAGKGAETLIAGFMISGSGTKRVVVRATGPALSAFGVGGVLEDPVVKIYRQGSSPEASLVAQNDDWLESDRAIFQSIGAFPLPTGSKDAAVVLDLPAGSYSAHVV